MPTRTEAQVETAFLADQLERSFYGGAWHGLALAEVLEHVDAETAACPLAGGCHSLWETIEHVRIWMEIARQRLDGIANDIDEGADWPRVSDTSPAAWTRARAALEDAHRQLYAHVRGMADSDLENPVAGSDPSARGLLFGILQHNAYHGGQIACLRRISSPARSVP